MSRMNLWSPREKSLELISGPLSPDAEGIEDTISVFETIVPFVLNECPSVRGRITAVLLAKAHRLGIGAYSIALDCVGQEAGALMRPLQEIYELLEYIRRDVTRAEALVEGKKPSAGAIAKAIDGRLQELRDYFNAHASHLSLSFEALGHLINHEDGSVRMNRSPGDGVVLRQNIATLGAVLNLILTEALLIVDEESPGTADDMFREHEARCSLAKERAIKHRIVPEPE